MAGAKINGKKRRVLTFSKGRADLVKKARQLAVLCDSQVALIIVSSSGTVYEYASSRYAIIGVHVGCLTRITTTRSTDPFLVVGFCAKTLRIQCLPQLCCPPQLLDVPL